jgi:hypothetical protein
LYRIWILWKETLKKKLLEEEIRKKAFNKILPWKTPLGLPYHGKESDVNGKGVGE